MRIGRIKKVWLLSLVVAVGALFALSPTRVSALLMLDPAPPEEVYKDSSPLEHIDPLHPPAGAVRDDARGIITVTREQAFGIYQADYLYENHGVPGRWNLREIVYRADPRFSKIQVTNLPNLAVGECTSLPNGKVTVSWNGKNFADLFGANPRSAPSKICANKVDSVLHWGRLYYTVSLYWDGRIFQYSSQNQDFTDSENILAVVTECLPNSDCTRSKNVDDWKVDDWTERMEYRLADDSSVYLWWRERKDPSVSSSASLWYDFGSPRVITGALASERFARGYGPSTSLRAIRGPNVSTSYTYQEREGRKRLRQANVGDEQYVFHLNPSGTENKHGYEKRDGGNVEMYNAVGVLYGTRYEENAQTNLFDEEGLPLRQEVVGLEPETAGAVTTPAICNGSVAQYSPPRPTWSTARASRKVNGEQFVGSETYPYTSYFDENGMLRLTELWADTRGGRRLRTVEYNTIGELFRESFYFPDGTTISDIYLYSPHSEVPSDARATSTIKKLISVRGQGQSQRETFREYGPDGRKTYSHVLKTGSSPIERTETECYEFTPDANGTKKPYTTTIYFGLGNQIRTDYDYQYGDNLPADDPGKGIFKTKITTYTITPTPVYGAHLIKEEKFLGSDGKVLLTTTVYFIREDNSPGRFVNWAEIYLRNTYGAVFPVRIENLFHGEEKDGAATNDFAPENLRAKAPNYLIVWDYGPFHNGNEEGREFTSTTKFETNATSPQFGKPVDKFVFPLTLIPFPNTAAGSYWGIPTVTPGRPADYLVYKYNAEGTLTSIGKHRRTADDTNTYTEYGTTYFRSTGAVSHTETIATFENGKDIKSATIERYGPDGTVEESEIIEYVTHASNSKQTFRSTQSFYDRNGMLTEVGRFPNEGANSKLTSDRLYFGTAANETGNIPFFQKIITYHSDTYTEEKAFIYQGTTGTPLYSTSTCIYDINTNALNSCTNTNSVIEKNLGDQILSYKGVATSSEPKVVHALQKLLSEYKTVLAAANSEAQRETEYRRYLFYLTAAISALDFAAHQNNGFNTDAKLKYFATGWIGYDKSTRTNFRGLYILPKVDNKISTLSSPNSIFIDMTTTATVDTVLDAIGADVTAEDYNTLKGLRKRLDLWDVADTTSRGFALDDNKQMLLRTILTDGGNVAYLPWQQILLATPTTGKLIQDMLDELQNTSGIDLESKSTREVIYYFYRYFYGKRLVDYSIDAGDVVQPAHLSILRGAGDCDDYAALGLNLLYNLLLRLGKNEAAANLGYALTGVGDPETSAVVGHAAAVWKDGENLYYIETGSLFQGLGKSKSIADGDILVAAPLREKRREGNSTIADWHFQIQYLAMQTGAVETYPVRVNRTNDSEFLKSEVTVAATERGSLSKSEKISSLLSYFIANNVRKPDETLEQYENSAEGMEEKRVSALARSIIRHIPRLGEQKFEDVLAYIHSVIYANSVYTADGATDDWKRVRETLTDEHLDEKGYLTKKLVGDCEDLAFVEANVLTVALAYYHIEKKWVTDGTQLSVEDALWSAQSQVQLIAERRDDLGEGAAHLSVAVFFDNPNIVKNAPFIILDPQLPHPSDIIPFATLDNGEYLFTASVSGIASLRTANWEKLNFMASVSTGGGVGGTSDQSSQRNPSALLPDFHYMQNNQVTGQTEPTPRGEKLPEVTAAQMKNAFDTSSRSVEGGPGAVEITVNPSIGHTDQAPVTSVQPIIIPARVIDTCCGTGTVTIPGNAGLGVPATIYVLHPATVVTQGTPYVPADLGTSPPICGITVTPARIKPGETAKLAWDSERSTGAQLDGESVSLKGKRDITPSETTIYTLIVTRGGSNSTCWTRVTIEEPEEKPDPDPDLEKPKPTCTLTVSPLAIVEGTAVTLTWSAENATTASLNGATVGLSGNKALNPSESQTYTFTAMNASGKSKTCFASVAVTPIERGAQIAPLCVEESLCDSPHIQSRIVTEKPKNSYFVGSASCSLTPTGPCLNRRYSTGWKCNVGFIINTHNTASVADDTCDPPPYRDIGLRIQRGGQTYAVAGALPDEMLSPFRLWRRDTGNASGALKAYGALLVPPRHPDASGLRIFQGGKVWSFITVPKTP